MTCDHCGKPFGPHDTVYQTCRHPDQAIEEFTPLRYHRLCDAEIVASRKQTLPSEMKPKAPKRARSHRTTTDA